MKQANLNTLFALAFLSLVAACGGSAPEPDTPIAFRRLKNFNGPELPLTTSIQNDAEWYKIWSYHRYQTAPNVNFQTETVLLWSLGFRPMPRWNITIKSVIASEGKIKVAAEESYCDAELVTQNSVWPTAAVVIPKTTKEVEFHLSKITACIF